MAGPGEERASSANLPESYLACAKPLRLSTRLCWLRLCQSYIGTLC